MLRKFALLVFACAVLLLAHFAAVADASGLPVDFVRSWYRGDRYEYAVTLGLNPDSAAGPYLDLA